MRFVLKWLGILLLAIVAAIALGVAAAWFADPAVVRSLLFGPPLGVVTRTDLNQPQEAVPGIERDDVPTGPADVFEPQALAAAEAYAARTRSVSLLVYQGGAIRFEKYWPGYDRNTRTDPLSGHKTVLALLVGAAIADGYIKSVDEPVATYLPEWSHDARRQIRIRDLLQMSSGLEVPRFPGWRSLRITLGSDLPGAVMALNPERPPGTDFQYANANSQILGLVIQNATGKRYAAYLSERLWSRLGAPTAYLWLDREGGVPRTFCCLYTTARAWLDVGRLILDQGRIGADQIVPAAWIREMTTPARTNRNYGYQAWLGSPPGKERRYNDKTIKAFHSEPYLADDIVYIDGSGGQRVYIVPSKDLIVVRMGTGQTDWDDAVLPNTLIRGLRPAAGTAPARVTSPVVPAGTTP
jgi:CubicO group peptidase (beta-lactamase class C family)